MIDLKKKKILVTGAGGFLGKYVIDNLFSKRKVSNDNIFAPTSKELDLTVFNNCLKAVKGVDIVIHLAGVVGGIGANYARPGEFFYNNLMMGISLMEAARISGVEKFTALGTVCCYPKYTKTPFNEDDLWNGYPEETNAPYGLAKKMLLVQSQSYRQQYGFNSIFLMPVNMYGSGDHFDPSVSHVIPALILKIYNAIKNDMDNIEVWGSGRATREFMHAEDGAEGIILATEKYDKSDPVNLGSGKNISIKELVILLCRIMKYKGKIIWDTTKPDGQPVRQLDISRAYKRFGFKAKINLEVGLRKTVKWFLDNQS